MSACLKAGEHGDVFILALGPTATVLAFDLAKHGYRALDLGHFDLQYEHHLRQAKERTHIAGKYNNELAGSFQNGVDDQNYRDSVMLDLSRE